MMMSVLRTFYKTKMRISPTGPIVDVQWFPCPAGAKIFPHPHRFYPLLWVSRDNQPGCVAPFDPAPPEDPGGIGESQYQFTTNRGLPSRLYLGQCFSGKKEWFLDGVPQEVIKDPMSVIMPDCCAKPLPPPPITTTCQSTPIPYYCHLVISCPTCPDINGMVLLLTYAPPAPGAHHWRNLTLFHTPAGNQVNCDVSCGGFTDLQAILSIVLGDNLGIINSAIPINAVGTRLSNDPVTVQWTGTFGGNVLAPCLGSFVTYTVIGLPLGP